MPDATPRPALFMEPLACEAARLIERLATQAGLAPAAVGQLSSTMRLLSLLESAGHVCVDLCAWQQAPTPWDAAHTFPPLEEWTATLQDAPFVGNGSTVTPFVLHGTKLYLYRLWQAENELSARLRARLSTPCEETLSAYHPAFTQEFPDCATAGALDWQAVAAFTALRYRFSIITGGPGTGKTSTVAKILRILRSVHPTLDIALAAPTGKAAVRLDESLAAAQLASVPGAKTIHRLLGKRHDNRFRHTAQNPLGADLLIVDEASMIDLELFNALLQALLPATRLVLLGDSGQLASVDAGSVLGDLCRCVDSSIEGRKSASFAEAFRAFSHAQIPAAAASDPLLDSVTKLTETYRSMRCPRLNLFAAMVRAADPADANAIHSTVATLTQEENTDDLRHIVPTGKHPQIDDLLAPVQGELETLFQATTPQEALQHLGLLRILTPLRKGPWGADELNRAIETWLRQRGRISREEFYHARPVLVTENDYTTRLFNGDLGIVWRTGNDAGVWFPDPETGMRMIPFAKLPPHETAWAMTVHKSQGSEFAKLVLVVPDIETPVLTRELLYTGLTRASRQAVVYGSAAAVEHALRNPANRVSGLLDALANRE